MATAKLLEESVHISVLEFRTERNIYIYIYSCTGIYIVVLEYILLCWNIYCCMVLVGHRSFLPCFIIAIITVIVSLFSRSDLGGSSNLIFSPCRNN